MDGIEELVKSTENDNHSEEQWNEIISQCDRQFIHQVITQTITPLQVDVIDSDNEKNGIKVLTTQTLFPTLGSTRLCGARSRWHLLGLLFKKGHFFLDKNEDNTYVCEVAR